MGFQIQVQVEPFHDKRLHNRLVVFSHFKVIQVIAGYGIRMGGLCTHNNPPFVFSHTTDRSLQHMVETLMENAALPCLSASFRYLLSKSHYL